MFCYPSHHIIEVPEFHHTQVASSGHSKNGEIPGVFELQPRQRVSENKSRPIVKQPNVTETQCSISWQL
jgi:hypothetical protein